MELIVRRLDDSQDKCYSLEQIATCESYLATCLRDKIELVFVTGNPNKVQELKQLMGNLEWVKLSILSIQLPEIQAADVLDVVQEKCKVAYRHVTEMYPNQQAKPIVIIEDTSLKFTALNGMPGPYIKWFLDAIGLTGLPKLLSGFDSNKAEAECVFALMAQANEIVFCRGIVHGSIVEPRGDSWGWDPVFEERNSGKTYGEMDADTKQKSSHRSKAVEVLKEYLFRMRYSGCFSLSS